MNLKDRIWFLALISCIYICCTLFDSADASEYDLVQLGLHACKSTNLCTVNASLTNEPAYTCCYECSCEKTCVWSRNCCPAANLSDLNLDVLMYKRYSTNEMLYAQNYGSLIQTVLVSTSIERTYSVVSKCPDMTSCRIPFPDASSSVLLQDYTLVNARDKGVIFLNRACARCHGITDVVEWGLFAKHCFGPRADDILNGNLPRSRHELIDYVSNWCSIFMEPPLEHQALKRRFLTSGVITSCNVTGRWEVYSASLMKACHDGIYEIFGTDWYRRYKNPYCMYCNQAKTETDPELRCYLSGEKAPDGFAALLRFSMPQKDTYIIDMEWPCGEQEIYDTFTKRCLIVHCQQLTMPFYGKCNPLPVDYVGYMNHFSLKFIPERDTSVVSDDIEAIPNAVQTLTYDLLERVGLPNNCIYRAYMFLYRNPDTRDVVLYSMTKIKGSVTGCTYLDAFRAIKILDQGHIKVKILLNGKVFLYRVEYYDNVLYDKDEYSTVDHYDRLSAGVKDFGYGSIMRVEFSYENPEYSRGLRPDEPDWFFTKPYTCPYLKFTTSELCDLSFVSQPLNDSDPRYVFDNIYKPYFHVTTEYVGNYNLDIHYRICVDDYLNIIQKSIGNPSKHIGILPLTLSSVALMCVLRCFYY